MTSQKKIEISQIKDLQLIFFYNLYDSLVAKGKRRYFGLKIFYGENQILDLDYTDEHFREYVLKVLAVYEKEKNDNDIIILNDLSEEIIENVSSEINDDIIDRKLMQKSSIIETGFRNFQISLIENYLIDIIKQILRIFYDESKKVEVLNISSYQNRGVVNYKVDGESKVFPIICIKNSESEYSFKISGIDGNSSMIIGNIIIKDNHVLTSWFTQGDIKGKIFYSLGQKIIEKVVKYNDKTILFDSEDSLISEEEQNKIKFYLKNFCECECENGVFVKTVNDSYLFSSLIESESNEELKCSQGKSCHLYITKSKVHMIFSETYGLVKYEDSLTIPFYEEKQEILLLPFDIDSKKYILVQRKYLPTQKMLGEYKEQFLNFYHYEILEVSQNNDLTLPFEIINSFEVSEDVKNIEEIKNNIVTRGLKL